MEPEPDTKDWTWTLTRRCPQCGLAAGDISIDEAGSRAFIAAEEWVQILNSHPAAAERPRSDVWSPLEYGAHVRDVLGVFEARFDLMLTEDNPNFANWDQDQAAIAGRYREQDPEVVAVELEAIAQRFVDKIHQVTPEQLTRSGRRSNGSEFTVETLVQYFLHDVVHHLWDVTGQQDATASLALE